MPLEQLHQRYQDQLRKATNYYGPCEFEVKKVSKYGLTVTMKNGSTLIAKFKFNLRTKSIRQLI